jgi:hypothetical protein
MKLFEINLEICISNQAVVPAPLPLPLSSSSVLTAGGFFMFFGYNFFNFELAFLFNASFHTQTASNSFDVITT